jgi:FkbM family methyltransferase
MQKFISRWRYYLTSIPTLLLNIRERGKVLRIFTGRPVPLPTVITLNSGLKFTVRTAMDIWIIKETCLDQDYETNGIPLQDGWTVVDIGAGLGDFTVYAAHKLPNSTVYAYEPFPESYALLLENLKLNNIDNVQTFAQAIGASEQSLYLNTQTGIPVKHSTSAAAAADTLAVEGVTLDAAFAHLDRCDFLKMDCEGAEYAILFNASADTLKKIRHLSMEYHETEHTHTELVEFLERHGFTVKVTANPAHDHIGFLYARRI